jgi:predicted nucleic acid-binding protein
MSGLFGWVPIYEGACDRARDVQQALTKTGSHRSAGAINLLIAATAERNHLTILCDDHDYLTVARVTDQPVKLVTEI